MFYLVVVSKKTTSLINFSVATLHLMLAFCPESLTFTRTTFPIPLRRRHETSRDLCNTWVVGRFFGMIGRWHGGSTASATFLGGSCASTLELHWLLVVGNMSSWQLKKGRVVCCWLKSRSIMRKKCESRATQMGVTSVTSAKQQPRLHPAQRRPPPRRWPWRDVIGCRSFLIVDLEDVMMIVIPSDFVMFLKLWDQTFGSFGNVLS